MFKTMVSGLTLIGVVAAMLGTLAVPASALPVLNSRATQQVQWYDRWGNWHPNHWHHWHHHWHHHYDSGFHVSLHL